MLFQVKDVTDFLIAKRTQRMTFKEYLVINADQRETMENVFALQFDQEYSKLRSETVLRFVFCNLKILFFPDYLT